MDKNTVILQGFPTDHVSEDEEGSYEESADEMSDDEELDDMMTLIQYQSEASREALIRKEAHDAINSH